MQPSNRTKEARVNVQGGAGLIDRILIQVLRKNLPNPTIEFTARTILSALMAF